MPTPEILILLILVIENELVILVKLHQQQVCNTTQRYQ